jgi:hypothetical protein
MKRLAMKILGTVLLTALAVGLAIPTRAQESEDASLAEKAEIHRKARAATVKLIVQNYAKQNPKYRAEVVLQNGSKAVGTITEIHESDFVMTDKKTKSTRTIAYADVVRGPELKRSRADIILGDTAMVIILLPLLPLFLPIYLIMMATGGMD